MVQQIASRVCNICSRLKPDLGGNNPGVQVCASNLVDCSLSQSLIHGTRKSWLGSFNNRVMLAILIACMYVNVISSSDFQIVYLLEGILGTREPAQRKTQN
jgi:hypothetical protein